MGLTGYGPPGRDGQLPPESHDDEAKRQAADQNLNRSRGRIWTTRITAAALVLALVAFVVLLMVHFG